jgi:undecaprenyl diphosphate synthase
MPNTTRDIQKKFEQVTSTISKNNNPLLVCLAINYSVWQDTMLACQALAQQVAEGMIQANQIIQQHVPRQLSYTSSSPDPEIDIRTSGKCRMLNFFVKEYRLHRTLLCRRM